MIVRRIERVGGLVIALALTLAVPQSASGEEAASPRLLTLEECIDVAVESNRLRPASQLGIQIAASQHRQALSSYWPQVSLTSTLTRRDDDPLFIFPEDTDTFAVRVGFQTLSAPITIEEKLITLQDRTHFTAAVDLMYPVYTGGLRGSIVRQTEAGLAAARQAARRTDLQVAYDVTRYYYGTVLARGLVDIAQEALARLEVTLQLAENLYKQGSGKVRKTDYLKHKVANESLRSLLAQLESNDLLTRAALANSMGLAWDSDVQPAASRIPFAPYRADLGELVGEAYRLNPDWGRLLAGLDAAAARVGEAKSGRLPRIAIFGQMQAMSNAHSKGIVGPDEDRSWLVGVGLEMPLFSGYLTRHQIREARARLERLEHQQVLLREGLALQVKAIFLKLERAQRQEQAAGAALEAAVDSRQLNERAYQFDLVDLRDMVETQLTESLMRAQYQRVRFDHAEAQAQLEFVIGREMDRLLR